MRLVEWLFFDLWLVNWGAICLWPILSIWKINGEITNGNGFAGGRSVSQLAGVI